MPENKKVAVIGLGYIGLPLACLCAEKNYDIYGLEVSQQIIDNINKGISYIPLEPKTLDEQVKQKNIKASLDFALLKEMNVIIVCVPTPIDKMHLPNLNPIKRACANIAKYLQKDQLIIIESTVNPGVLEEIVKPILEKSKLVCGQDFYLAHCPERIDPGNQKWTIKNIPRVVGAISAKGAKRAQYFYESIMEGEIKVMKSIKETEAVKIVENTFRDINIAFVNELARSFGSMGIDTVDVIAGAATKPFAFMPHWPGCGVGGHCIPVDPYYLIEKAKKSGFNHEFLKLARRINNAMPQFTVDLTMQTLNQLGRPVKRTKIGILGLTYKKNMPDTRESPAYKVIKSLKKLGAQLIIYDPYVLKESSAKNLSEVLKKSECIMILSDHDEFKDNLTIKNLEANNILALIDGKNCLNKEKFAKSGIVYRGIGR